MADVDETIRGALRDDGEKYQPNVIEAGAIFAQRLRRRRLRNKIGAAAMALALGTGGAFVARALAHPASFVEPASTIVPWTDGTPSVDIDQTPPPQAPASMPACQASDLSARFIFGGAATGHAPTVIEFTNFGTTDCALQGVPLITLIKPSGAKLDAVQTTGSFFPDNGNERVAVRAQGREGFGGPPPLDRPLIGRALLYLEWIDCESDMIRIVDVTLPGDHGTVRLDETYKGETSPSLVRSRQPGCDGGLITKPELHVDYFQSVQIPARVLVDYSGLSATIAAPESVRAGERLRYTVTIYNSGAEDFLFSPCPAYSENLFKAGITYLLNCAAASPIPAGEQETFEMFLDVLSFTPSGTYDLNWRIVGGNGSLVETSTSINVCCTVKPTMTPRRS